MERQKSKTVIKLIDGEKKGLRLLGIMLLLTWGGIVLPFPYIALVSWISTGLIGLSIAVIISKLIEREDIKNG